MRAILPILAATMVIGCNSGPLTPTYVPPPGYDPNKPLVIPAGCHLDPWPPPPRLPFAYKLVCDE